jgi:pimeloyl-ACP methyl ester carboxylesterase
MPTLSSTIRRLRPARRPRRVLSLVLASAVALTLTTAGVAGAVPLLDSRSGHDGPKPTVVLVHGAFADASGWSAEVSRLQRRGYPVIAAPDPLRGLTSDSDYVRSLLRTISGPIILVGHSYGGAVITNAARGVPNVKALVYVSAFLPAQGESVGHFTDPTAFPGSLLSPASLVIRPVANPAAPGGADVDVSIAPDAFPSVFAGDLPVRKAAVLAATQRPISGLANAQASGAPAWATLPSWALVSLDDKAIPPAAQLFMTRRAGSHTTAIHSAHDSLITHPSVVDRLIIEAADATG